MAYSDDPMGPPPGNSDPMGPPPAGPDPMGPDSGDDIAQIVGFLQQLPPDMLLKALQQLGGGMDAPPEGPGGPMMDAPMGPPPAGAADAAKLRASRGLPT